MSDDVNLEAEPSELKALHWINGVAISVATDELNGSSAYQAVNPATGEPFGPLFGDASLELIQRAATGAAGCFDWMRKSSVAQRAELLRAIAERIQDDIQELIQIAKLETGLPEMRLKGEVMRICNQARDFAKWIESGAGLPTLEHSNSTLGLELSYMPIGPVAIFGASNFPFACSVFGGDTCSALAMGCPVVFKAHPAHPMTSTRVANNIQKAFKSLRWPGGACSLVHGIKPETSRELVSHDAIEAVAFTGSRAVGVSLYRLAASRERPIPFFGELGSVNPIWIHPDAYKSNPDFPLRLASAFMMGCGQFCTNPGIWAVVKGADSDRFVESTFQAIQGSPLGPLLTKNICAAYRNQIEKFHEMPGVELVESDPSSASQAQPGFQVQPVIGKISASQFLELEGAWDEVFGPFAWVVECDSIEQMRFVSSTMPGQLCTAVFGEASYWSQEPDWIEALSSRVGRLLFNDYSPGAQASWAFHHGGPFPASTHSGTTSIGLESVRRFVRPICRQTGLHHLT